MCLFKAHRFPKIAWKPIKVYKYLYEGIGGKLYTPSQITRINLNVPIRSKRNFIFGIFKDIIEGEGVHSSLEGIPTWDLVYLKCNAVIPRFSLYWIGERGDIASTKLIVTDKYVEDRNT